MFNSFKVIDIFSFNPNLCFNGEYRYRSIIGIIISLLFYIIVICLGTILLKNYIDVVDMNIIHSDYYGYDNEVKLSDDLLLIKIFDDNYQQVPESLVKPFVVYTYNINGTIDIKIYNMKKCDEKDFNNNHNLVENITNYYCLNTSALKYKSIKLSQKSGIVSYFSIYISFCNSSSILYNQNCASQEEKEKYKNKIY